MSCVTSRYRATAHGSQRRSRGGSGSSGSDGYAANASSSSVISAGGTGDGTLRAWDATTGGPLAVFLGPRDGLLGLAVSPDGRHVLTGAKDAEAAQALRAFLTGAEGRAILKRYGFTLPGE